MSVAKALYLYNRYTVPVALVINAYMMAGFAVPVSPENLYSISFETLIVILIVIRTWRNKRRLWRRRDTPAPLTDVLLTDGLIYFCTMVLLLIAGLIDYIVAPDPYALVGIYFLWSIHATLVSRIYLHLRDVSSHVDWTVHTDVRPPVPFATRSSPPPLLPLPRPREVPSRRGKLRLMSDASRIVAEAGVLDISRSRAAAELPMIEITLASPTLEPEDTGTSPEGNQAWREESCWWPDSEEEEEIDKPGEEGKTRSSISTFTHAWWSRNVSRATLRSRETNMDSQPKMGIPMHQLGGRGEVEEDEIGRAL
ncbi:hypothetical protein DACRYDRAFT_115521 [Dacryopinax primogenitus]|uniref:Uncharacterized protein n=1 Tax=Dacryopinax primogenitus (strain DJM 731) TaxID=1858805 RepID=M5G3T9_DACPD|nr:uncharacterized protein DACRYDRAFT_115521 [Dacryopinax primogenitus]EJU03339.1 hypothetical protein DACRYDRAFT_115521 [Dacryopinax primogenitus]